MNSINSTVFVGDEKIDLCLEYNIKNPYPENLSSYGCVISDWKFKTNGEIELSSYDYIDYLTLWKNAFESIFSDDNLLGSNILIIGGGDLQIGNLIKCSFTNKSNIEVVDPLTFHIQMMASGVLPHIFRVNDFKCHDVLFEDFYNNRDKSKRYKIICIDVSDDYLDIANSFYTNDLSNKINDLLDDNGYVIAYAANESLDLGDNFEVFNMFSSYINTYSNAGTNVCIFKKVVDEST